MESSVDVYLQPAELMPTKANNANTSVIVSHVKGNPRCNYENVQYPKTLFHVHFIFYFQLMLKAVQQIMWVQNK